MLKQKWNPFLLSFFLFSYDYRNYDAIKCFVCSSMQKQIKPLFTPTIWILQIFLFYIVYDTFTHLMGIFNIEKELVGNFDLVEFIMGLRIINPCFNWRQLNPKRKTEHATFLVFFIQHTKNGRLYKFAKNWFYAFGTIWTFVLFVRMLLLDRFPVSVVCLSVAR